MLYPHLPSFLPATCKNGMSYESRWLNSCMVIPTLQLQGGWIVRVSQSIWYTYKYIYIYIYMPSGLSFQTSQYNPFAPNHKHLTSWAQSACCDRSWVCVFILAVKKTQKLFVKLYINFANLIPLCCSLPALETIFSQWLGRTHLQDSKSEHHWRSPLA